MRTKALQTKSGFDPDAKITLPSAEVIAQLVALLCTAGEVHSPEKRIDDAITLYLFALQRRTSLEGLTLAELIVEMDHPELSGWLAFTTRILPDRLRLYPDGTKIDESIRRQFQVEGDSDPVRSYLSGKAHYFTWKKTDTVWRSIRLMFLHEARKHNAEHKDAIAAWEREYGPRRRRPSERWVRRDYYKSSSRRRDGQHEFEMFKKAMTVRAPTSVDQHLTECVKRERQESGILYWELDREFLDDLIRWRNMVKNQRDGGLKRLAKELLKGR